MAKNIFRVHFLAAPPTDPAAIWKASLNQPGGAQLL